MRQAISLALAGALLVSGLYLIAAQIINGHFKGALVLSGAFLATLGAGWIWSDLRGD